MAHTVQNTLLHAFTMLAYALHIGGGFVGLVSGTIAIFVAKAGRLHRQSGNIFFVSMMVMAGFAIVLGFIVPDPVNIVIGAFAAYLIATAWMTVRRKDGGIGLAEKIGALVAVILWAPFAILSFQLALGLTPFLHSTTALKGPVVIAIDGFTLVLTIAVLSDARMVWTGGITGAPRIARHLWRMCVGLTLATGSAFTNGFARLLPRPYHVPVAFFLPQLVPLILLIVWMIKVRVMGWKPRGSAQ